MRHRLIMRAVVRCLLALLVCAAVAPRAHAADEGLLLRVFLTDGSSVVTYGAAIEHTFTLKELVRRGEESGGRLQGEPVQRWLSRLNAGRRPADLMGDDPADDIADPVGRPCAVYEQTADLIENLLQRFVVLLVGGPPRSAAYAEPSRTRRGVIRRSDYASGTSPGYSRR